MSTEQPNEATIFNAARQMESLGKRAAFLTDSCGDDAALRERIEKLLAAFAEESQFLEQPASGLEATIVPSAPRNNLAASLDAGLAPAFGEEAAVVIRLSCQTSLERHIRVRDGTTRARRPCHPDWHWRARMTMMLGRLPVDLTEVVKALVALASRQCSRTTS